MFVQFVIFLVPRTVLHMFNLFLLHDWIKKYLSTSVEREVEYATFPSNVLLNKVSEGIVLKKV